MKKYFTYIIIAAAVTFAASCAEEHIGLDSPEGKITLRLQTAEMETRATVTETGNVVEGEGIENTLTHADFFFFSDAEGENLINHVRLTVGDGGLVANGDNIYEYTFDVSDEGNALQNASYVYVLANYPVEINGENITLSNILDLDINIDLSGSFSSFVMDSYDSESESRLTLLSPSTAADSKTLTIGLKRAAAKIVFNFNVKDEYVDAAGNEWTPVLNQMWVNFVNARKVGKVAAEPVAFDAKTSFFTTAQVAPTSETSAKEGYTSWSLPAVYTYPQEYETYDVTAPYYKIFIPWVCDKKGQNNFYYKIILPELGSFKRNKIYKLNVDVSVIGGTEDDWALVTDYVYVADFWAPETIESSVEGAMYLDVPVKYYEIYGIDYIDVPVVSSNDIEVVNVTGTKTNLYDGSTVSVTPTVTVNADGKSSFKLMHVLNDDITSTGFDCTPITYTMTVKHTEGGLSKTVNVTVVQYPSIYVEADASNGYAYVNSYTYTTNRNNQSSGTDRGGRWNYGKTASTYNASNFRALNNNGDILGTMTTTKSTTSNYNQYVIHISVLSQGYKVAGTSEDAVIGDPRGGSLTSDYLGYAAGTNGGRVDGVKAAYDAVSSTSQNVIAPALRVASSWGASNPVSNFDLAEERCAAYQENGYPAGRWRLPTLAEIDFLINLSFYNHIPALFNTVANNHATIYSAGNEGSDVQDTYYSGYWSGGKFLYVGSAYNSDHPFVLINDETGPYRASINGKSSVEVLRVNNEYFRTNIRCVYDEWYWSSQKYGNNGTASNTAATQWIGYIF